MTTPQSTRRRLAALLAVPVLIAGLAACAGETQEPEGDGPARITDSREWALAYAACMREHGIDMEDPAAEGPVVASGPTGGSPEERAATEACLEELGRPPGRGGSGAADGPSSEEMRERLLVLAQCLRELGYDVEDPAPGSGLRMPADLTEDAIEQCLDAAPPAMPGAPAVPSP